jgi:ligand-binding sensor domain-containing protein
MRYALFRLTWLLLLPLFYTAVHGQEYSYAHYDVKDGLAGSVVYCGAEDKDGFLWFGTESGLSRFDGTRFRNFTTADGLPDNEILRLFVDSKGRVWIMPFRNSICYYWKGKIYNQQNDSVLRKIQTTTQIIDIVEDSLGNILVSGAYNCQLITTDQQVKTIIRSTTTNLSIAKAGVRHDGRLGLMVNVKPDMASIWTLQSDTYKVEEQHTSFQPHAFHIARISPVVETFAKSDSIYFIRPGAKEPGTYPLPGVTNLSLLNDSLCAMGSIKGATIFDFKHNKVIRTCLPDKQVNSVFLDSEGNYWFTTAESGIYRIGSFEFQGFTFSLNNKDPLGVFSILKWQNQLYVGTAKGILWRMDTSLQQVKAQYIAGKANYARILSLLPVTNKRLAIGSDNGLSTLSGGYIRFGTLDNTVKSIVHFYDQRLLVAAGNGVYLVNDSLNFNNPLYHGRSTSCLLWNGKIYVGTLSGLHVVDNYGRDSYLGEQIPLLQSRIVAIAASSNNILWIATNGNGLLGLRNDTIAYTISQADGLTSDICRSLYITGNTLWLGTDKGLNRVELTPEGRKITTYTEENGLMSNTVNSIFVDGSQVYAGTPIGLTSFHTDKISLNSYCKLRMTGIQVAGRTLTTDTTGFLLPPAANSIRFDYVAISYRSAGDISYRYRLIGLNNNWQTTRETFLSYPSLPSGDYELQLIATNKFGVESDMIRIPFTVGKRLWEKTWFRLLALLIIGALIWIFVSVRIRKIRRQNNEKMQINDRMAELEQMALKAQMNPHFIFNSLNSVQQYVIDKDLRGANKFITEFSRLIRLTLDISSRTKISIYEEVSYLSTYLELEKTKFEDKFSYNVVVEGEMDSSEWFIPPMILQPYVENSIRHGVRYRHDKLGHIRVSFSLNEQYLICQVEDNGVGRKKAAEYKSEIAIEYQSKGMTLTAKRIEMLNKNQSDPVVIDIEDMENNHAATGTRVVVRFPVQDASTES